MPANTVWVVELLFISFSSIAPGLSSETTSSTTAALNLTAGSGTGVPDEPVVLVEFVRPPTLYSPSEAVAPVESVDGVSVLRSHGGLVVDGGVTVEVGVPLVSVEDGVLLVCGADDPRQPAERAPRPARRVRRRMNRSDMPADKYFLPMLTVR
ncbi:hypothetical protein [Halorarum salinum]|uniref:hypothetical protein n=1 Tax=Halorarum salinum TaxID=2743089 RepID=UPI001FE4DAB5|nr:hypothetical protein [Halobaculum salinum]